MIKNKIKEKIWNKAFKDPKFERNAQILQWMAYNKDFIPAEIDARFRHWLYMDITSYCMISSDKGSSRVSKIQRQI